MLDRMEALVSRSLRAQEAAARAGSALAEQISRLHQRAMRVPGWSEQEAAEMSPAFQVDIRALLRLRDYLRSQG